MRLPDLVAYQAAVQHPATAFSDTELRTASVATNRLGLPRVTAGNFALTYQLCTSARQWAVRCFHRDVADRARRYAAISETLASLNERALVGIEYLPVGVRVGQQWYPVTKMRWLEGRPLNRAVELRLSSPASLVQLEQGFIALTTRLQQLGLAHGDLQHGNILVDGSGDLKLVDYDGMYVPALRGLTASEAGDPNYQHPGRKNQFNAELDRFSALVIVLALRVLAEAPDLWRTYNTDDNLLFRRADFVAPDTSPLFRDLRSRSTMRDLAERFARVCQSDYAVVPLLVDFLRIQPQLNPPIHVNPKPRTLGPADVVALNRLYTSRRNGNRSSRRSWSIRRAVAQEALAFTPDGGLLATAEVTGKVRVREATSGRVAQVWSTEAHITELAYSPDGRRLIAGGPDGCLRTLTLNGQVAAQQLRTLRGGTRNLAFGSAGPIVAVADGSTVNVWVSGANRLLRLTGSNTQVDALALSVDGRLLSAACADGSLRCWSIPGGALVAANRGHRGRVTAMAIACNGQVLASADTYGVVRVWAIPGGRVLTELQLGTGDAVQRLVLSPDCAHIAGAASGRLVIWDVVSGVLEHTLAHSGVGTASGLAFSPDGSYIAVTTRGGGVSMRSLARAVRKRSNRPPATPRRAGGWLVEVLRKFGAAALAP